jgi:predicted lipid-binding transport protein (Tim44 family)
MEDLQFSKAEFADNTPKCAACKNNLGAEYFQLAGQNICAACAEQVRQNQARPAHADVMRGLLYGAGMAFLCFFGYALVIWFTGFELALVTILMGYLIGNAVRKGSRGLGGRRCQIAAVALTYFAITFSYAPVAVREFVRSAKAEQNAPKQDAAKQTAAPAESAGPLGIAIALILLLGSMLFLPFFGLAEGIGGILSIVIIGFGLQRAWQLTARDPRILAGPFTREQGATAVG